MHAMNYSVSLGIFVRAISDAGNKITGVVRG